MRTARALPADPIFPQIPPDCTFECIVGSGEWPDFAHADAHQDALERRNLVATDGRSWNEALPPLLPPFPTPSSGGDQPFTSAKSKCYLPYHLLTFGKVANNLSKALCRWTLVLWNRDLRWVFTVSRPTARPAAISSTDCSSSSPCAKEASIAVRP